MNFGERRRLVARTKTARELATEILQNHDKQDESAQDDSGRERDPRRAVEGDMHEHVTKRIIHEERAALDGMDDIDDPFKQLERFKQLAEQANEANSAAAAAEAAEHTERRLLAADSKQDAARGDGSKNRVENIVAQTKKTISDSLSASKLDSNSKRLYELQKRELDDFYKGTDLVKAAASSRFENEGMAQLRTAAVRGNAPKLSTSDQAFSDAVNDRNRSYNKLLEKTQGTQSKQLKINLERGTAM